jgi:hypothetical protein
MSEILQLVPTLPPPPEGVGTYALALADALAEHCGIASRFVVCDPGWRGAARGGRYAIESRQASDLVRAIETAQAGGATSIVLAHYVGYGYAKRGCPVWLVDGLERWLGRDPNHRLVTLFHEVWATAPPWRSSFWLWPLQHRLVRRLARRSRALVTSLESSAAAITALHPQGEVSVLPIFSTVGEPESVPELRRRPARLVLFGGAGRRARAYGPLRPLLEAVCRACEVEEVVDVGPPVAASADLAGRPVRQLGVLPADEVSRVLLAARLGFVACPSHVLAKSTVFAAYAAHGLAPVCAWPGRRGDDEPTAGSAPFLPAREAPHGFGFERLETIAAAAHAWYRDHCLEHQAAAFAHLLRR